MTHTEKAEHLIAFMQSWGLTYDEMLEVIAIAKRKLEAMKNKEELNKPCKQIQLEI